jgi:hypothetical protein
MNWIARADVTDRWPALVNAVMNVWVPLNVGYFMMN